MEKIVISIVEINEVLEKVGELEEENRGLRKQLEEREEEATGLLERIGVIQQEYKELEAECFKYKRDRCEAMRELNLN
jgi:predicted  nucleic acid-binding Zn-ribbon protein